MLLMMYCMLMSFVPLDLFLHVMLMLILFVLFSFYMLQHLHYHSGGLRLNPNLYTFRTVCPSLLNTWSGSQSEMWTPGKSTMLQVLLSIQALVLNEKPYFNEPGLAPFAGQAKMEKMSENYSENAFILSCKTMMYTLRKPPKVISTFSVCLHSVL